ncbi:MAG TPA: hypothetical protein VFY10_07785 [Dehalococcoidia bacterium]|nr:hypothetical protein [Dehalococcoidia bacterium]
MSQLGDLLELMHAARNRYASLHVRLREEVDTRLWVESARRWEELRPGGSLSVIGSVRAPSGPSLSQTQHEVWAVPARRRWREESEVHLTIIDGDRGWSGFKEQAATARTPRRSVAPHRIARMMLDPMPVTAFTRVASIEESTIAGRALLVATAAWRDGTDLVQIDWPYATTIRFAVDAERGVLLSLTFELDERAFIDWLAEEIAFDEPLPETLFELFALGTAWRRLTVPAYRWAAAPPLIH